MKKRIIVLPIVCTSLVSLALFLPACTQKDKNSSVSKTPTADKPIAANIYVVEDTTIREQIRLLGTIVANEEVQIVSEKSRRLVKVNFTEGAYVQKGQLLFKLDDADLRAQLKKLIAQRKLYSGEEFRSATLLKREGISKQEYERVASSLEAIEADIEIIQVELSKTEIRAPFSGKTGIRQVSEGAFVQPNTTLVSLEDIGKVKIEFAVPEKYANSINLNQEIEFTVENSDQAYTARIAVIEPTIDQSTRSLFIRAIADNSSKKLIPGSSAMIELQMNQIEHAILIPTRALIPSLKGNSVLLVKDGKAVKNEITTGIRSNLSVQVTKGLSVGDSIMTSNILRAKPGVSVRPVKN